VVLEAVARTGCNLLHVAALAHGDRKLARVIKLCAVLQLL